MIAVIFEVIPTQEGRQAYLDHAAVLAPLLGGIDGFLSIERFQSLADPGKLLSLSFWRDEAAIAVWRNLEQHRAAQNAGRTGLFAGYRLRIAGIVRDYGLADREQAPADSVPAMASRAARERLEGPNFTRSPSWPTTTR